MKISFKTCLCMGLMSQDHNKPFLLSCYKWTLILLSKFIYCHDRITVLLPTQTESTCRFVGLPTLWFLYDNQSLEFLFKSNLVYSKHRENPRWDCFSNPFGSRSLLQKVGMRYCNRTQYKVSLYEILSKSSRPDILLVTTLTFTHHTSIPTDIVPSYTRHYTD
jgi:hypothetical protein